MLVQFWRRLVATVALIAIVSVSAATLVDAQSTDQTGRRVTDFSDVLSVSQFNPSQGDLVQADFTISGSFDSQVLQITNSSNETADFDVSTFVGLCADRMSVLSSVSYAACSASASPTALNLTTTALQEQFYGLVPGGSDASAAPLQASDSANFSVTDLTALSEFIGTGSVSFGAATTAGFQASGAGGNSLVEVETYADVGITVDYRYANVSIVTTTNGSDGISLTPGAATTWAYTVTNTGNVDLSSLDVTDNLGGLVCTIAYLAPGASQTCTTTGVAGSSDYDNVGSVSGVPTANPAITVSDDDPTSYVVPAAQITTTTTAPTETDNTDTTTSSTDTEVFGGLENPNIDIELATNGTQADSGSGPQVGNGSTVELTYVVTNTGTVDLTNVVVIDNESGEVCREASLAIAHSFSCTASAVVTCGQHARSAQVQGRSGAGVNVSDTDPTHHHATCAAAPAAVSPAPSSPAPSAPVEPAPAAAQARVADEPVPVVLAFTGVEDGPTRIAISALGLGFAALLASEGLRRRASRPIG